MMNLIRRRIVLPLLYSIHGLKMTWKLEEAFRVEVLLFLVLAPASFFMGETALERMALFASLVFVLVVELLNTALEKTIDRISTEQNDLSKIVKDIGSAAVFLSILNFLVVWWLLAVRP